MCVFVVVGKGKVGTEQRPRRSDHVPHSLHAHSPRSMQQHASATRNVKGLTIERRTVCAFAVVVVAAAAGVEVGQSVVTVAGSVTHTHTHTHTYTHTHAPAHICTHTHTTRESSQPCRCCDVPQRFCRRRWIELRPSSVPTRLQRCDTPNPRHPMRPYRCKTVRS